MILINHLLNIALINWRRKRPKKERDNCRKLILEREEHREKKEKNIKKKRSKKRVENIEKITDTF